mmetsp:Transcript_27174/g.63213  ORF Transcript_27174/g.63213 Transcript_27174/m.63213 type:complete len:978 (-) Transcript_27174:270-3203(-)
MAKKNVTQRHFMGMIEDQAWGPTRGCPKCTLSSSSLMNEKHLAECRERCLRWMKSACASGSSGTESSTSTGSSSSAPSSASSSSSHAGSRDEKPKGEEMVTVRPTASSARAQAADASAVAALESGGSSSSRTSPKGAQASGSSKAKQRSCIKTENAIEEKDLAQEQKKKGKKRSREGEGRRPKKVSASGSRKGRNADERGEKRMSGSEEKEESSSKKPRRHRTKFGKHRTDLGILCGEKGFTRHLKLLQQHVDEHDRLPLDKNCNGLASHLARWLYKIRSQLDKLTTKEIHKLNRIKHMKEKLKAWRRDLSVGECNPAPKSASTFDERIQELKRFVQEHKALPVRKRGQSESSLAGFLATMGMRYRAGQMPAKDVESLRSVPKMPARIHEWDVMVAFQNDGVLVDEMDLKVFEERSASFRAFTGFSSSFWGLKKEEPAEESSAPRSVKVKATEHPKKKRRRSDLAKPVELVSEPLGTGTEPAGPARSERLRPEALTKQLLAEVTAPQDDPDDAATSCLKMFLCTCETEQDIQAKLQKVRPHVGKEAEWLMGKKLTESALRSVEEALDVWVKQLDEEMVRDVCRKGQKRFKNWDHAREILEKLIDGAGWDEKEQAVKLRSGRAVKLRDYQEIYRRCWVAYKHPNSKQIKEEAAARAAAVATPPPPESLTPAAASAPVLAVQPTPAPLAQPTAPAEPAVEVDEAESEDEFEPATDDPYMVSDVEDDSSDSAYVQMEDLDQSSASSPPAAGSTEAVAPDGADLPAAVLRESGAGAESSSSRESDLRYPPRFQVQRVTRRSTAQLAAASAAAPSERASSAPQPARRAVERIELQLNHTYRALLSDRRGKIDYSMRGTHAVPEKSRAFSPRHRSTAPLRPSRLRQASEATQQGSTSLREVKRVKFDREVQISTVQPVRNPELYMGKFEPRGNMCAQCGRGCKVNMKQLFAPENVDFSLFCPACVGHSRSTPRNMRTRPLRRQ